MASSTTPQKTYVNVPEAQIFSQVTVFDGAHGDCNLIDVHEPSSDGGKWRRVLVDTGYRSADGVVANAIEEALTYRAIPAKEGTEQGALKVPPLRELQITHFDEDHIGNAARVVEMLGNKVKQWQENEAGYRCDLLMTQVPPAYPKLSFVFHDAKRSFEDKEVCNFKDDFTVSFKVKGLKDWKKEVEKLSLQCILEYKMMLSTEEEESKKATIDKEVDDEFYISLKITGSSIRKMADNYITALAKDATPGGSPKRAKLSDVTLHLKLYFSMTWGGSWEAGIKSTSNREYSVKVEPGKLIAHIMNLFYIRGTQFHDNSAHDNYARFKMIEIENAACWDAEYQDTYLYTHDLVEKVLRAVDTANEKHRGLIQRVDPEVGWRSAMEYIASPNYTLQRQWIKKSLMTLHNIDEHNEKLLSELKTDNLINRVSIVTIFARKDLKAKEISDTITEPDATKGIRMLFTGDAYDQPCDIQNTIAKWTPERLKELPMVLNYFHVIKIPHHGSHLTVSKEFFFFFRAEVYLICAQNAKHGNPKYSSLSAIVKTFKNKERPSGLPFRLFFSDPRIDKDGTTGKKYKSGIKKLLEHENAKKEDYYFEAWKLKEAKGKEVAAYGSIAFYIDAKGSLQEEFRRDEWEEIKV